MKRLWISAALLVVVLAPSVALADRGGRYYGSSGRHYDRGERYYGRSGSSTSFSFGFGSGHHGGDFGYAKFRYSSGGPYYGSHYKGGYYGHGYSRSYYQPRYCPPARVYAPAPVYVAPPPVVYYPQPRTYYYSDYGPSRCYTPRGGYYYSSGSYYYGR